MVDEEVIAKKIKDSKKAEQAAKESMAPTPALSSTSDANIQSAGPLPNGFELSLKKHRHRSHNFEEATS